MPATKRNRKLRKSARKGNTAQAVRVAGTMEALESAYIVPPQFEAIAINWDTERLETVFGSV